MDLFSRVFLGEPLFCPHTPSPNAGTPFKSGSHYRTRAGLELAVYAAQGNVRLSIQLLQPPRCWDGLQMCALPHLGADTTSEAPTYPLNYQVSSSTDGLPPLSSVQLRVSLPVLCFGDWYAGHRVIQVCLLHPWMASIPLPLLRCLPPPGNTFALLGCPQSSPEVPAGTTTSAFQPSAMAFLCLKCKVQTCVLQL